MELPLTEPCPQCGAEMEPRKTARRGRTIYECPECGYQMEITEPRAGGTADVERDDLDLDGEDDENGSEEDEDGEKDGED